MNVPTLRLARGALSIMIASIVARAGSAAALITVLLCSQPPTVASAQSQSNSDPGGALAHELAHASGDRIGVDDALDRGLAVGCVGASEGGGPETCFAGGGPEREVGHSR